MFVEVKSESELQSVIETSSCVGFFFYTPFCGTCKLARKMCEIVMETIPGLILYSCNVNFFPSHVQTWKMQSVPGLLVCRGAEVVHTLYAFESVEHVYKTIKEQLLP